MNMVMLAAAALTNLRNIFGAEIMSWKSLKYGDQDAVSHIVLCDLRLKHGSELDNHHQFKLSWCLKEQLQDVLYFQHAVSCTHIK